MERLTEWKDDKKLLVKTKFSGDFGSSNILIALAEYEDLEEQGLLLRLPCKVGDIVYRVINQRDNYDDTIYQIVSATIFELSMIDKIGKTIFLTKTEAEQKLKEMEVK